jgi:hypothetical protein
MSTTEFESLVGKRATAIVDGYPEVGHVVRVIADNAIEVRFADGDFSMTRCFSREELTVES